MTVPTTDPIAQAKAQARARLRAQRRAVPAAEREASARAMAAALADADLPRSNTTVAAFLSLPTEPDTAPLIEHSQERGCRILVPAVRGRHLDWMVLPEHPPQFTTGVLGIPELASEPIGRDAEPLADCGLVLVPCLALDSTGRRLGQGGGYYDRILAELADVTKGGPLLIGVCFPAEFGIDIPVEDHDAAVHGCLTGAGLRWFRRP
ncbi:MAG: 5-formyltetrahydrofolate cyclo-ligase [Actinomycetales bacterium]